MAHLTKEEKDKKLKELQQIALSLSGKCLSKEYINSKTKLSFICKEGHKWDAIPSNVKKGHWCKICGNIRQGKKKVSSIEEMHKLATSNNGKCLSTSYKNNSTKLLWECDKGHQWEAVPSSIQQGRWCPKCAGKLNPREAYNELETIAQERGGKFLSAEYKTARTNYKWQCNEGHIWKANADNIRRGHWCPKCALKITRFNEKRTLQEMQELAISKGGKCLSKEYINSDMKLIWECEVGHKWKAVPYHIQAGSWCPICSSGISERIFRALLEKITKTKFPKRKPRWLVNSRGNRMELDGYNEDLGIAFEYQGVQHYKPIKHFFRKSKSFQRRQEDDELKRDLCRENNVHLIEVPYTIKHVDFQNFINKELKEHFPNTNLIKYKSKIAIYKLGVSHPKNLIKMQNLAMERGGECLSNFYINNNTKLKWRCLKGHIWNAVPSSIQSGTWCPECANELAGESLRKYRIEDIQNIAQEKGGICLSKEITNIKTKVKLECKLGHKWETSLSVIIRGHWCPKCEKIRLGKKYSLDIEEVRNYAIKKNGRLISNEYFNNREYLEWECKLGHKWRASFGSIRNGSWCPECAGKLPKKKLYVKLKEIAKERGGKLLSKEYLGHRVHHEWKCKLGHIWTASADNIKRGTWCPKCSYNERRKKRMK